MVALPAVRVLSLRRSVPLLAAVALIVALTLTSTGGDNVVEVTELDDIVDALRRSEKPLSLYSLLEGGANILLFFPFGAALGLRGFSIGKTALYGFVLSAAVEGTQLLFISGRTTSVDDVLLNSLGAVLGQVLLSRFMPARVLAREDPTP